MHLLSKLGLTIAVLGFIAIFTADAVFEIADSEAFARAWTRIILFVAGALFVVGMILKARDRG